MQDPASKKLSAPLPSNAYLKKSHKMSFLHLSNPPNLSVTSIIRQTNRGRECGLFLCECIEKTQKSSVLTQMSYELRPFSLQENGLCSLRKWIHSFNSALAIKSFKFLRAITIGFRIRGICVYLSININAFGTSMKYR